MCNLKDITITSSLPENGSAFLAENERYFIQFDMEVNLEEERSKIEEELEYAEGFVHSVEKKLSNKRFVENAPEEVVEKERQKLKDGRDRVAILRENLVRLVKN